jgi:two-component system cell cycle sensor histidine kinase/response regulator CckA
MSVARVLVVDDDDAVRSVTVEMLKRSEYEVVSVSSGQGALDELKQGSFDLILLDVGMPGMSGIEAYNILRANLPEQKVLFMTGYAEGDIDDLGNPNTFILPKPFTLRVFTETVASII